MKVNMRVPIGMACVLILSALPFAVAQGVPECADGVDNDGDGGTDWLGTANDPNAPFEDWDQECTWPGDPSESGPGPNSCTHFSPHSHSYGTGGSAGARSDTVTGGDEVGAGIVTVFDTNTADCDGDGLRNFDGDYDSGVGGAFFGYGPWANEPTCNYGLAVHGGVVVAVNDVVFGADVWFTIGADDTSGPVVSVDPVTGETTCETDGSITPGDPATDPTADADDCLTAPQNLAQGSSGATCGAGGDGGYWVFLNGLLVTESAGNPGANNAPTAGTITA